MRPAESFSDHEDPQPVHAGGRVRGARESGLRPQDPGQAQPTSDRWKSGSGEPTQSALFGFFKVYIKMVFHPVTVERSIAVLNG